MANPHIQVQCLQGQRDVVIQIPPWQREEFERMRAQLSCIRLTINHQAGHSVYSVRKSSFRINEAVTHITAKLSSVPGSLFPEGKLHSDQAYQGRVLFFFGRLSEHESRATFICHAL
mmetsp:Transcript_12584/g.29750  ORF Transcript_12584/g.29750 Transcript_12584/m.29750 type:complete len:117 (-) Transcript_12584:73-423(-)